MNKKWFSTNRCDGAGGCLQPGSAAGGTGGSALGGAAIGGLAGGKKGAAIGALAGAGGGYLYDKKIRKKKNPQ